jgi:hypothetical protein
VVVAIPHRPATFSRRGYAPINEGRSPKVSLDFDGRSETFRTSGGEAARRRRQRGSQSAFGGRMIVAHRFIGGILSPNMMRESVKRTAEVAIFSRDVIVD